MLMALITANTNYITLLGTGKYLTTASRNMIAAGSKDSAVRFKIEKSKTNQDKVIIGTVDGDIKLYFESSNSSLKYSDAFGSPFELLLVGNKTGFGFSIRYGARCLILKNKTHLIFGSCRSEDIVLVGFPENTTGDRIDETLIYNEKHEQSKIQETDVIDKLKWSEIKPDEVGGLLEPFDVTRCQGNCSPSGKRVFTRFDKF